MIEAAAGRVVFENPDHDFPQRISYWPEGDDLRAAIEGTQVGVPRRQEFHWKPVEGSR